ncbi:hypothetical protein FB567DRAFT_456611 [Paraphoma chrysanthemicola]|uniref:Zn(2)-C6 fungal-type domain-containing protein n=1 Tax=Paraphoma chrysanthemicola TaxID=798071 RepID=A0A8K0QUN6_9PLEO|nr:hypothetical protein FB567DRAFT_456611 [Paraphoma chrysanthemicola]
MPNVGRPSKGCQNCRARKIKCDQKRPSCSQCKRAGRDCQGYRDPLSMMFKNESEVVAKKAEKRYEKLAKQKPPSKKDPPTPTTDCSKWSLDQDRLMSQGSTHVAPYTRYPTPESMTREIVPSIQDHAVGFFIGNYVAQPQIIPRGQFEWIVELLAQPDTEEVLQNSVYAASLAGFANASKSPTIMQQAQKTYGAALRMTNEALRSKETAIKDTTLIAVIMLGMYENFVFKDRRSIQAWAKHVDGACALIELRGKDQFQSSLGRRLFHQFYGVVMLVALETGREIPTAMHELYQLMTPTSDYSIHGRQWTTRLIDFMHSAINLNKDKESDPKTMVETALKIDHELDAIKGLMPRIWDYDVIHLDQPSEHLYGRTYHIYLDAWIAQMWNNVNSCRLSLYNIVRENLARGWMWHQPPLFSSTEYDLLNRTAEAALRSTCTAIFASVPQITGMIPFPDLSTARRRASRPESKEPAPLYTMGTYLDVSTSSTHMVHLIWPLYAAAQIDLISSGMRQWCIDVLHYVALRIGTRQAVVLADELKEMQRAGLFTTPFVDRTTLEIPHRSYGTGAYDSGHASACL